MSAAARNSESRFENELCKRADRPDPCLLVVEDDPETRTLSCSMIARRFPDFIIYNAENGRIGLELCKTHAPDIVITDINMPVMDGVQMAEEIKAFRIDTRIIVLTGYSDKVYLERFQDLGVSDYILKPIEFRKLVVAIEKNRDEPGEESPSPL